LFEEFHWRGSRANYQGIPIMRYDFLSLILFIILIVDVQCAVAQTATPYARPSQPGLSVRLNDPWTDPTRAPILAAFRQTALADPAADIRRMAIGRFGESHRNQDLLFAALQDPDARVWREALEFLWIDRRINSTFASDLTAHLSHPDNEVRRMAALALRDVAPWVIPETLPRLAALLLDRDAGVREAAIYALEAYGEAAAAAALPVLEGPPASKQDDRWLRRIALEVCRIAPQHPDPAAWLLLQPPDWANDDALSRAVVGLATESGIDIAPGLSWVVANGAETVWPRALPVIDAWSDDGLRIWLNPIEPLEAKRMVPGLPMRMFGEGRAADVRGLTAALLVRIRDPRLAPELRMMAVIATGHLGPRAQAEVPALRQLSEADHDLLRRLEFEAAILRIQPDEPTAVARLWAAVTGNDPGLAQTATELLYDASPSSLRIGPDLGHRILAALGDGDTKLIERVFPVALTIGFPLNEPVAQRLFPGTFNRVKNAQPPAIPEIIRRLWALSPFITQEQGETIVQMLLQRLDNRKPSIHLAVLPELARVIDWQPPFVSAISGALSEPLLPSLARPTPSARRSPDLEKEVFESLLKCLSDPEPSLRQATLMALGFAFCVNVDHQSAFFDALAERLQDEQQIRSLALSRLVTAMRVKVRVPGVPPMSDAAWSRLLDRLDTRLGSKDRALRLEAIGVLTELCGEEQMYRYEHEPLVHAPPLPEWPGEARTREATRRLVVALDGADAATRRAAAVAILNIGFARNRDTRPLQAAWEALRGEEKDPFILSSFAFELERVMGETPATLDLWRRALSAPEPAVETAPQNLSPLPGLYRYFYSPARPALSGTLADEYLAQLQGADVTLRRNAARALRRLARWLDERQALALLRFVNDPDYQVRREVHEALWMWFYPFAKVSPAPQAPSRLTNRYQLWPPPPGNVPVPLKDKCPGLKDRSWAEVVERLTSELLKKYAFVYYFAAPEIGDSPASHGSLAHVGGIPDLSASVLALLTEIEPVHPDGSRIHYAERGTDLTKIRPKPPKTWGDFLRQLIGKPPGRYRMVLFVLKPSTGLPPNKQDPDWDNGLADSQALNPFGWSPARDVETIQNVLPAAMRGLPVGDGNVWVVFFDIERHRGGTLKPIPLGDNWFKNIHDSDLDSLLGAWPAPSTLGGSGR
jgi:HEAT repeat protein